MTLARLSNIKTHLRSYRVRALGLLLTGIFLLSGVAPSFAAPGNNEPQAIYRLLMLVEYIGSDYARAVENGAVVSAAEYGEMQEFSQALEMQLRQVQPPQPSKNFLDTLARVQGLREKIDQKASFEVIRQETAGIRRSFYDLFSDQLLPPQNLLDLKTTRILFIQNCALCHGPMGAGDGPSAKTLQPPPRNFYEMPAMLFSSPAKSFHVVSLGLEGTAMASFPDLSVEERWSLGFFVNAIRHFPESFWHDNRLTFSPDAQVQSVLEHAQLPLEALARASDQDLLSLLQQHEKDWGVADPQKMLAAWRVQVPFEKSQDAKAMAPSTTGDATVDGEQNSYSAKIDLTLKNLDLAAAALNRGALNEARQWALDAYILGFDPLEKVLALHHPDLMRTVESDFILMRGYLRPETLEEFAFHHQKMVENLSLVRTILNDDGERAKQSGTWKSTFASTFASFVIIFREGFEAFLIIGALLALMRNLNAKEARKWIHAGWMSAVVVGLVSFWGISHLLVMTRIPTAVLEGLFTGVAALVLFYVSFWLMNQSERVHWEKFLKTKTREVLTRGRMQTLFTLAFFAVFREALETVLFYQALVIQTHEQFWTIPAGFSLGVLCLIGLCVGIQKFGVKIPLRKFFLLTSILMMGIAFVLIGKAIHEFIEAGVVRGTHIDFLPSIDLLGIYPLAETWAVQGLFLGFCVGFAFWLRKPKTTLQTPL